MRIAIVGLLALVVTPTTSLFIPNFNAWAIQFSSSKTSDVLGDSCNNSTDCPTGTACVAGSADEAIQSCVQHPVCGGNLAGNCPGFQSTGQLVCAWTPTNASQCSDWANSCTSFNGIAGIYKCMSLDRCDSIPGGVSCSIGCKASNGITCNGRGSCQNTNGTGYTCECNTGWKGIHCETVVNGTCQEGVGGCGAHGKCVVGACVCDSGYSGAQCELTQGSTIIPLKTSTPGGTTTPSSSDGNKDGDGTATKSGSNSTTVIIIVVLAALGAIVAVAYLVLVKKKREREAAEMAALINRDDDTDRIPTPKSEIQVL